MSNSADLYLTVSHRRTTLTSAQPLGSRSPVLNHRHVQLSISLSHCVSQENHLEYHIISTLCTEDTSTSFHLRLRENDTHPTHGLPHTGAHNIPSLSHRGTTHPAHGIPHPTQGTTLHIRLREEPHTDLMGTPKSWASSPHTGVHTTFLLRPREEQHTHLMGTPNSWDLSQADSLSLCPGGCLTQL
jgi:hypothetical protein